MWSIILSVTFIKAEGKRERERQCIYPSFSFLMFDYPSNLPSCCNNLEIGTLAKTDLSQCLHASLNMQHWRGKILSQFFTKASAQGRAIKSWKMLLCRFPDWWRATQVDICIWYLSPDHSLLNSIKFSGEKNRAPSKSLSLKKSVKHSGKVSNIQYYWAHILSPQSGKVLWVNIRQRQRYLWLNGRKFNIPRIGTFQASKQLFFPHIVKTMLFWEETWCTYCMFIYVLLTVWRLNWGVSYFWNQ